MAQVLDVFEKRGLDEYINNRHPLGTFVLNRVFKNERTHQDLTIDYEEINYKNTLAGFATSTAREPRQIGVAASPIAKTYTIPVTWETKVFSDTMLRDMNPVGNIYGSVEVQNKYIQELIATELDDLQQRVANRREQMACEALITGAQSVTTDGRVYSYDYGYTANEQTVTLSTLWTTAAGNPVSDLKKQQNAIAKRCGLNADVVIMGEDVAEIFLSNTNVQKMLDTNNFRTGVVDVTSKQFDGAQLIASNFCGMDIYSYPAQYTNDSGVATAMFGPKKMVMAATASKGFVLHKALTYEIGEHGERIANPGEYAMRVYRSKYGNGVEWTCKQASIPMIHEKNAVVSIIAIA